MVRTYVRELQNENLCRMILLKVITVLIRSSVLYMYMYVCSQYLLWVVVFFILYTSFVLDFMFFRTHKRHMKGVLIVMMRFRKSRFVCNDWHTLINVVRQMYWDGVMNLPPSPMQTCVLKSTQFQENLFINYCCFCFIFEKSI